MSPAILWMHDLSAHADAALHAVRALALLDQSAVVLGYARLPEGLSDGHDPGPELERVAMLLRRDGVEVAVRVSAGRPEDLAARWAEEEQAHVVVVRASRVSGIDRFLVGSTARRILRAVSCSTLVVCAHPFRALRAIVVPIDIEHRDDTALLRAAELSAGSGAAVTVLSVVPAGIDEHDLTQAEIRVRTHAERALGGRLPDNWSFRALVAETAQEGILFAAEDQDLVVLTSHGRTGLARLLEGSVAEDVVEQCPVSVLVAR
jgi:nucleotide-binding universal stress UspA family protein